jgi:hypothetical protein
MPLSTLLLPEFDAEIATTRTVLQRVPEDRLEWRPHEKAFPMGHLAQLVAMIPGWTTVIMNGVEFDLAPKERPTAAYRFMPLNELLALLEREFEASSKEPLPSAETEEVLPRHR